jgi:hypothetical protein
MDKIYLVLLVKPVKLVCVVTFVPLQRIRIESIYVCELQLCDLHVLSQETNMSGL